MRKPSINRSSILEIALEGKMKLNGGGNGNFAWEGPIIQYFCHAKSNLE